MSNALRHVGQGQLDLTARLGSGIDFGTFVRDETPRPNLPDPQGLVRPSKIAAGMRKVAVQLLDACAQPGPQGDQPCFDRRQIGNREFLFDFVVHEGGFSHISVDA